MPTQTLGDVIARVYSKIDNNTALYTRLDVVEELNDSFSACNLFVGAVIKKVPILTVGLDPAVPSVPQLVYPVPDGMIFPVAVDYEGRSLSPVSLRSLAGMYRSWATDVSSPGRPVKEWAPLGITKFILHPMDSAGGRELLVTGVAEPEILVNDTDLISLPGDFVDDVVELTASVLPLREGGQVFVAAVTGLFASFINRMKIKAAYTNLEWPTFYEKLRGKKPRVPVDARLEA